MSQPHVSMEIENLMAKQTLDEDVLRLPRPAVATRTTSEADDEGSDVESEDDCPELLSLHQREGLKVIAPSAPDCDLPDDVPSLPSPLAISAFLGNANSVSPAHATEASSAAMTARHKPRSPTEASTAQSGSRPSEAACSSEEEEMAQLERYAAFVTSPPLRFSAVPPKSAVRVRRGPPRHVTPYDGISLSARRSRPVPEVGITAASSWRAVADCSAWSIPAASRATRPALDLEKMQLHLLGANVR